MKSFTENYGKFLTEVKITSFIGNPYNILGFRFNAIPCIALGAITLHLLTSIFTTFIF